MFALNAIFAASSEMPNSIFKNLFALPALVLVVPIQLKKTSLPFQAVSVLERSFMLSINISFNFLLFFLSILSGLLLIEVILTHLSLDNNCNNR